ncbi:ExeA family protein [Methylotuvimicrobium sp. KM1]|uniref:ExeA family protein n=1 Tax=Methylotuvimicrobium sp. KM1 TaxID=3377707 RepID=UPI00384D6E89
MYQKFFGLKKSPFSLIPEPEYLYLSQHHKKALNTLRYGVFQQAGFTLLTGDIGCGKTTLLQKLLNDIKCDVDLGLITNTHPSFGELLTWVLRAFNVDSTANDEAERYRVFKRFMDKRQLSNRRVLLVIDEAQNMDIPALESLRLLSNINDDGKCMLQIILAGQSELLEKINDPKLIQFAQRISIESHIKPLSYQETKDYIGHRLSVAGGRSDIFSRKAVLAVFEHSGGVPRVINNICDLAMVFAFANDSGVEYETVMEVVNERRTGGIRKSTSNQTSHSELDITEMLGFRSNGSSSVNTKSRTLITH